MSLFVPKPLLQQYSRSSWVAIQQLVPTIEASDYIIGSNLEYTISILTQSGLNFSPVIGSSAQSIRYSVDLSPIIALILYTELEGLLWPSCVIPTNVSSEFQRFDDNLALLDRICSVP